MCGTLFGLFGLMDCDGLTLLQARPVFLSRPTDEVQGSVISGRPTDEVQGSVISGRSTLVPVVLRRLGVTGQVTELGLLTLYIFLI